METTLKLKATFTDDDRIIYTAFKDGNFLGTYDAKEIGQCFGAEGKHFCEECEETIYINHYSYIDKEPDSGYYKEPELAVS